MGSLRIAVRIEFLSLIPDALLQYVLEKGCTTMVSTDMGHVSQKITAIHPMYYINSPVSLHHADFAKQVCSSPDYLVGYYHIWPYCG